MDALEFAREYKRMCSINTPQCCKCPANGICNTNHLEELVPIIEKWSAEHPILRNVDHYAELTEELGYKMSKIRLASTCPMPYRFFFGHEFISCPKDCHKCRKWWLEEYKGEDINVATKENKVRQC